MSGNQKMMMIVPIISSINGFCGTISSPPSALPTRTRYVFRDQRCASRNAVDTGTTSHDCCGTKVP
jgi:hypothetical protein